MNPVGVTYAGETKDSPSLQHGLCIMERFVDSIEGKITELEEDVFYLKQWIKLTQEGTPTVLKITTRTP
jgi:hypothetical protein